jgi:acyl carrier protein
MGLDSVEFVMELEHEFKITITDPEAEAIRNVGDAVDLVHTKLGGRASKEAILDRVKPLILYLVKVDEELITLDARLADDLHFD